MKKDTKFALAMILAFAVTGCALPPGAYANHGHKHKRYYDCTQVQEANGQCEDRVIPDSGAANRRSIAESNEDMRIHRGEDAPRYKSSDGITIISKHGVALPSCNEMDDASQADNGSKCWWTRN